MRMFKFISLCLLIGCGTAQKTVTIYYRVPDKNDVWLQKGMKDAADFWSYKGVILKEDEEKAEILILSKELPGDRAGQFEYFLLTRYSGFITVIPSLEDNPNYTKCVLAHEVGHALRMDHVADKKSLLSPVVLLDKNKDCYWSHDDEEELCRVNANFCGE